MTNADWHARWREQRIGFHRPDIHPMLEQHWPTDGVALDAAVFVPLAGKSLDMHWLADQGHRVVGIELSPVAVAAFFDEAGLTASRGQFRGIEYLEHGDVRLYIGDAFALTPAHLAGATACYDRAALVALDPPTRQRYAALLAKLMPAASKSLLVTVEYDQAAMSGPPYAVTADEVATMFGADFDVETLDRVDVLENEPKFRSRGLRQMHERAWRLTRRG